jgi:hypothetical protein
MSRIIVLLALLGLASCTPFRLVPPGPLTVEHTFVVDVPHAWNAVSGDRAVLMTMDGPTLDAVVFHPGIEDGKTLFYKVDLEAQQNPLLVWAGIEKDLVSYRFRKDMSEHELMDLYIASATKMGDHKISFAAANLAPFTLGGKPGFRFDYTVTAPDGVHRRGMVVGAVVDEKLSMIDYRGTSLYHFEKHKPAVDAMIASLRFVKD